MAREWWRRLPAENRREYERSESISEIEVPPDPAFGRSIEAIRRGLEAADRTATEKAAQGLVDRLSRRLSIPSVTIRVRGRRPADGDGELHGIYHPAEDSGRDQISVWMRTAKLRKVVAVRTFVRTLLHEIVHHIDHHLLDLPHSYHSKGFYQRESSLLRAVTRQAPLATAVPTRKDPPAKPAEPDIERGLTILRAAIDDITNRQRR